MMQRQLTSTLLVAAAGLIAMGMSSSSAVLSCGTRNNRKHNDSDEGGPNKCTSNQHHWKGDAEFN